MYDLQSFSIFLLACCCFFFCLFICLSRERTAVDVLQTLFLLNETRSNHGYSFLQKLEQKRGREGLVENPTLHKHYFLDGRR